MKITILTLFPNMFRGFLEESIVKRAKNKGIVEIDIVDLRDFAKDSHGSVDDRPYGGGAGMVIKVDVIHNALNVILGTKSDSGQVPQDAGQARMTILTSPRGKSFDQQKAREYSKLDHLVILCGHYEGVDERVMDFIDEEISIGDFVLTGGEIPAAAIVDAVVRLIPSVLEKEDATANESFFEVSVDNLIRIIGENELLKNLKGKTEKVKLLEYPQYTRPEDFQGKKVPQVLLSGNHKDIEEWRIKKAFEETLKKRPDLL